MYSATWKVVEKAVLTVGTHRYGPFAIEKYDLVSAQWGLYTAAGVATINLYAALAKDRKEVTALDPSANAAWAAIPSPFSSHPNGAISSQIGPIGAAPGHWLMVEIVVSTQTAQLSVWIEGKGKN